MQIPPSELSPREFTLISMLIGYSLIGNLSANEQNAVGNWFILLGQILETNSAQQQVIEERITKSTININSKSSKQQKNFNEYMSFTRMQEVLEKIIIELKKISKDFNVDK